MTAAPRASQRKKAGPASDKPFTFPSSVGDITVPSLSMAEPPPPFEVSLILDEEDSRIRDAKMTVLFVKTVTGDDFPAVKQLLRRLPAEEFAEFAQQWQEHSGVGLGE